MFNLMHLEYFVISSAFILNFVIMYCVEEIYQDFLPGDLGPMFTAQPDYSTQFEKFEDAEKFCDDYNRKYENTLNEWPKLHPHLMTEQDTKAWKEQQEYENEVYDRW